VSKTAVRYGFHPGFVRTAATQEEHESDEIPKPGTLDYYMRSNLFTKKVKESCASIRTFLGHLLQLPDRHLLEIDIVQDEAAFGAVFKGLDDPDGEGGRGDGFCEVREGVFFVCH